ncbi:hypothetical protein EJ05DRAFT_483856 [Pseudovirgaria hyperparasitica]|uniref:Uncharacterized protein n=1 Tax=Pseudovirgaria hyperparasitica TaxID=470096 RepID=A0A6A6WD15_9PEZI|nr:uncharacterized protein EJ05DRAFT_483856 [Pseudovirgaria hyperparasitica]KAF2760069.1 hypothetical protein EJ05DRAFT_483856 [Pseudovirgaria hyperparasitica]
MDGRLIARHASSSPQSSWLVYTLSSHTLVRIGPDIAVAIQRVVAALETVLHLGPQVHHFATTYSLSHITIILRTDIPDGGAGVVDITLLRLRLVRGDLVATEFHDSSLCRRIADQLQSIQKYQPGIEVPFRCVEDWMGYGIMQHQIYDKMLLASKTPAAWSEFKKGFVKFENKRVSLK